MNKEKKQSPLSRLLEYAGNYKKLTFIGLFLSGISMICGMIPYVCIWLVLRKLIKVAPDFASASVESFLGGKKIGIFGSYGWGDGQWMGDRKDRCVNPERIITKDGYKMKQDSFLY